MSKPISIPKLTGQGNKPNCITCPNRIAGDEVARLNGRAINGDVCLVKKKVLNSSKMSPEAKIKLGADIAKGCSSYGEKKEVSQSNSFQIAVPISPTQLILKQGVAEVPAIRGNLPSCRACIFFVSPLEVASELGWNGALCAAKGELIMPNKLAAQGTNCDIGVLGEGKVRVSDLTLFNEYQKAFSPETSLAEMLKVKKSTDPADYETDEDVSPEDIAKGIKAWRYIQDNHDRVVKLPIFDEKIFSTEEIDKIPHTGDDEHPELYIDHSNLVYKVAALWFGLGETPALWGSAGLGKTELLRHMAWLMQIPFIRLSITGETDIDDIAGKMLYNPEKGTYFQYGRLPNAYTKAGVVCLDEPNTGPPEVWQFIRPLTDNSKQLALDMNKGESLKKHPFCFLGLAMNPAWDVKNVGAMQIGAADGSRLMHISVELPPPGVEKKIIADRVKIDGWEIDQFNLDLIMRIAGDIRRLCDDDILPMSWGIREQIKVARAWRFFDTKTVYRVAAGDYLDPQAREQLTRVLNSYIAG